MSTKIAVVYASKHGHVRTIAERLAAVAATRDAVCRLIDVQAAGPASLDGYDGVIIAGSVHFGRHATKLRRFVARKLAVLSWLPTAFISVSGSAAAVQGMPQAEQYLREFLRVTAWQPDITLCAAGAMLYTKYDPITRLMMKFAARTAGRATDTTRDHVYTDWATIDDLMHLFLDTLERHARKAG